MSQLQDAILAPVAKEWKAKVIPSYELSRANQNAQELLFTDLVNTNRYQLYVKIAIHWFGKY